MEDLFAHLLALTSYISRQFIRFVEDLVSRDVYICSQDARVSSSGQCFRYLGSSISQSILHNCPTVPKPSNAGGSLQARERRVSDLKEQLPVNCSEVVETCQSRWSGPFLFQGFILPIFGLRLAWRLAITCWKSFFLHIRHVQIRVCSFISRVQRTLHGSSSEIGWLQRAPGVPHVKDGTTRFMELLDGIRNGEHTLPNSFVYLLIPGLFSNHSPLYFVSTKRFFSKMGLACHIAKIHSEASVEHNAWELKQYIEELYWGSGKRILLLGHSKGGVDAAAALSIYWSALEDKVAGLALVQSPYGGTPIASDILREGQIADKEARRIMELLICTLIKGDIRALEDLTYEKRKEFIMKHKLPEQVPLVSFHSEASVAPGVLAMMSHIGHAELPWFPFASFGGEESNCVPMSHKVPVLIPLAAAMAVSALHLQLRYGEKSDGLVTRSDAEVPGSVVVRPERKLNHAWMVYSSQKKDPYEPDAREVCEALLTLLVEIGK
ncbi:uncharacterized protein LOC122061571 [Macadamia integrifolia]|uniref:uncharacterized protein LOC122061571 n=1 Tax=Macadamia integrifolia TaxID=60698 RepID=UPI001C4E6D57|nr:uncharacterized protein LOC122061571 [Macadamia integrifolia]XP_042480846.1 uncharacterized protein LOC122061571 [Macadamia integrifolia]XP_042480854.1 uncharacterized protein LOC122061571 [Macadamia integrifolia]XP_042480862.1 uncharacterized protein LOC122061571 [Macadamia integrifolia]XP_042480871.1 uncharacterized protein LOC122061571 [Macadamia integrifolia]XP_042480880.1 uncharacterized protein LOC122061571 [Macadamia integrifolia]XP_042480884.1 uncharacterized protein LOC122061571 [